MDLSTLTDAELDAMIAAQSGGTIAAAPTAQPAPQLESNWINTIAGTTAKAGQGIFGGFLDEMAAGATAPLDVLGGLLSGNQISLSDAYSQNLAQNRAALAAFGEQAPVLSTVAEIGGAIASPINKLGMATKTAGALPTLGQLIKAGAAQGAVYGAGSAEGNDAIIGEALKGATLGGGAAGALGAVGKIASYAGKTAKGLAESGKNKLYGLQYSDIKQSLEHAPIGKFGDDGLVQVQKSLDSLIEKGRIIPGEAVETKLTLGAVSKELADEAKQLFKIADDVQPSTINHNWANTKKYILKEVSEGDKEKAEAIFEAYAKPIEQKKVFLSELDKERSLMQGKGAKALGEMGGDEIAGNIYKNIGLDLKQTINEELAKPIYKTALGKQGQEALRRIRKEQEEIFTIMPAINKAVAREKTGGNLWDKAKAIGFTSGGYGVPMGLAVMGGVPALPAAAVGYGVGSYLNSTPGQQALLGLLQRAAPALSSTGAGLQGAALPASRALAAMLTGNEVAPEQMESASAEIDLSQLSDAELDAMIAAATPADTALPTAEAEGFERTSFVPQEMPEMTLTSDRGIDFIKQHEGLRLTAYDDGTGTQTIGYGHTKDVPKSITKEEAEAKLVQDIEEHEQAVKEAVKVPLTQEQFDALTSFTFNLGAGALKRSTLLKKLNAGDYEGAADEFLKWNKARIKGKLSPMRGLTKRRQAERELFLSGLGKDLITV